MALRCLVKVARFKSLVSKSAVIAAVGMCLAWMVWLWTRSCKRWYLMSMLLRLFVRAVLRAIWMAEALSIWRMVGWAGEKPSSVSRFRKHVVD